jgi:dipeptidase E
MRIFLASEAKNPVTLKNLEHVSGGIKGKKIAYIPTAANGEDGWESWKKGGTWQIVKDLGADIKLVQLEDFKNNFKKEDLGTPDIIWFAGGVPGYLMYWIRRCALDEIIPRLLSEGCLYVGSSAGAMVAGQSLDVAEWGFVDGEHGSGQIKPLGLVNFDIYPHYRPELQGEIKNLYKGKKLYLLENEESILVDNNIIKIFGKKKVI